MRLYIKPFLIGISFITILFGACSTSEDVLEETVETTENIFSNETPVEANHTDNSLSFYLPEHFEIVEIDQNNIILKKNSNTYVIFYNDLEKPTSKLFYESAKRDNALIYQSFETDDRFGYIRILEADQPDYDYEIQIGIGGVKITTHAKEKNITKEAERMMKIGRSIIDAR